MNLQNIFPRAMVMNVEQALKISKDSLGIDVEVIANNDITHYIQDENNVFMLIKDMVRNALHIAFKPFQSKYKFDSDKDLLQHYHYDFTSLETIAVFKTIDNLRDQFTEINQYKTINEYEILYQSDNDVKIEAKKKRIKKLQSKNKSRNKEHLEYLNYSCDIEPVVKAKEVSFYNFLSNHTKIREFIYTNKIPVGKDLIEHLGKAYVDIEKEFGFDRFMLDYSLEYNTKIDMMTHFVYFLCGLLNGHKIDKSIMDKQLGEIASLHKYKIYSMEEYSLLSEYALKDISVRNVYEVYFMEIKEIMCQGCKSYDKINSIVFGLQYIYNVYKSDHNSIYEIQQWVRELNIIVEYASICVAKIFSNIFIYNILKDTNKKSKAMNNEEYEYSRSECDSYNKTIFSFIDDIAHSDRAIEYFDRYSKSCMDNIDYHIIQKMSNYHSVTKCLNKIYMYK